ncbi:hypothetical protein F8O07_05920 [Pseudoclavibacter sp. CFCC 13796]|nr:hypothetical protein F8O07_05920 [Pseudoclavibacter sp. CFCC 13796]
MSSAPQELLCRRGWRLRHSTWVLWGVLSFGIFACVGWLYIGIRMRRRWVLWVAGVLTALTVGYFILASVLPELPGKGEPMTAEQQTQSTSLGGVLMLLWAGSTTASFFANRQWLIWRAWHSQNWYAQVPHGQSAQQSASYAAARSQVNGAFAPFQQAPQHPVVPPSSASPYVQPSSSPLVSSDWSQPQRAAMRAQEDTRTRHAASYASPQLRGFSETSARIDLNTATPDQLRALPGLSNADIERLVAVRRTAPYRETSEVVTRAGVPPHIFATFQDRVEAVPVLSSNTDKPRNGRRLEF